ncbi:MULTISPECIES: SOS response-associated peptidase [unclassified Paenibacillus]|uniref:SOS response-associated peptidase n=1 Tax=unclassified Paenibacillus TaxID=185978 RepID=UPI001AE4BF66|nr:MULTISPECIES: SOS response-associated peptidase [unclassified Paenibacillus]MBP1155684.1 putative SOS response-associated peptidase YedK [Paenibacillus sp. PvP091]MBP1168930.1 putative SOS response-associated peptidase YedK [Paenibacillus sp. PvR098]MBP2439958.1 putative SOS response-associated peptidase YedK [Paenibacillus sp. PvP052]
MCDRFSLTTELHVLSHHFQIGEVHFAYKARSHIVPTQQVSVIIPAKEHRRLEEHRWGLVPFWAKDAVNADSAIIHEKPAYRKMFSKQRCVIPCNGFYVWESKGKNKKPIRIEMKDKRVFGMAGLYEIWKDARGREYRTCTVMTTVSNRLIYEYDERMPVILNERDIDAWLDPQMNGEPDFLQSLLKPYAPDRMKAYSELPRSRVIVGKEEELLIEEPPAKYAMIKK